ncbi:MAG: 2-amino-4-hydroxy-6-hydroxymethyldihydropteridine diphosphokinase [Gammaproteobacteria bacterium]|nr:2-amino-4-hydroxy-6-hydroxymethyldihydropteridine diphosphokinase [Gammaproteobacteria bacterium]
MTTVILSLGSNIDREQNIAKAIADIRNAYGALKISPIYETSSVGFSGPPFFNLVVGFQTGESVISIRDKLREIESTAGRVRGPKSFASRVLDIDIILYGDQNLLDQGYNIPRDEIDKYAYVLKPLADLYPQMIHPVSGLSIKTMWQQFDSQGQILTVIDFPV